MTFPRVNPSGWAAHDKLTSTQQNQLDIDHTNSADMASGGTYTPSAKLDVQGQGGSFGKLWLNSRVVTSGYTIDGSGSDVTILADMTSLGYPILLPVVASTVGRIIAIKRHVGASNILGITPNGADAIDGTNATLNLYTLGSFVVLQGTSAGWEIIIKGGVGFVEFLATAASAFTVPPGVHWLDVEASGAGGGGSGGTTADTSTSKGANGGPGGGGAPLCRQYVSVTPALVLDVNIGAPGTGGAANTAGNDGGDTTLVIHGGATIFTAKGGGGGGAPPGISTGNAYGIGGTISGAQKAPGSSWDYAYKIQQVRQGGFSNNALGGGISTPGGPSEQGYSGGTAGSNGAASGSYTGGGGGGGGAAGPYGNGAQGNNGGNGNGSGTGTNGVAGLNANANTGAGGGGGGGGGFGSGGGGGGALGGNGGSGRLRLYWHE